MRGISLVHEVGMDQGACRYIVSRHQVTKTLKDACKWNHLKVHLCAEKVGIKLIVCHTKHAILKYLRNLFRNSRTSREVYNYGICNLFETVVKLIGSVVGPY